jgi:F-type H+-transporting ATPase subunit a
MRDGYNATVESPLEQFKIAPLAHLEIAGYDVSFNNSALLMVLAVALITALMVLSVKQGALVPGRFQSVAEMLYSFVANMVEDNAGHHGMRYFPFVFTLFMFVLLGNLLGMIPFSFTYTSHIIVTFALASAVFIGVTILGLFRHGLHFFSLFFPKGAPLLLAPLIIPIELLSYLSRPVSLSIRLFANMMAGHTMLAVFASFAVGMGVIAGLAPLALIVALTGFELLVAALQAYVFAVLTCIYLHDALELH